LVDILIQFDNDCIDNLQLKEGDTLRYSGKFNRFRNDYRKGDADTFLFPNDNRDVDQFGSDYPNIEIQPKVMTDNDEDVPFIWNDDENDFISFSSN